MNIYEPLEAFFMRTAKTLIKLGVQVDLRIIVGFVRELPIYHSNGAILSSLCFHVLLQLLLYLDFNGRVIF